MIVVGRLAYSKCGRDKGKLYLVIEEEGDLVWLADGTTRGIASPKKKNRKHIQPAGQVYDREEIAAFRARPAWGDNCIRERIREAVRAEESGRE